MSSPMNHLAFPMKKHNLFCKNLISKINSISPFLDNYYSGVRRWGGQLPDNILIFSRLRRKKLSAEHLSTYFHHRWVLLIAMEGSTKVRVNSRVKKILPGTALLIPPLHFHHYYEINDGDICWLYITFDWPGQHSLPDSEQGPNALSQEALEHTLKFIDLWHDGRLAMTTLLCAELLTLLFLSFPDIIKHGPSTTETSGESQLVATIRQIVSEEPDHPFSIDELAVKVGMSASHLRAEFRADTGISLGRYLREWRLREAALLLTSENLSVKETAERLGYRDIYAFSRAFSRAMGISPSSLHQPQRASSNRYDKTGSRHKHEAPSD